MEFFYGLRRRPGERNQRPSEGLTQVVRRIKPRAIARYDGHCHLVEGTALLAREIFRSGSFSAGAARHRISFNERTGAEQAALGHESKRARHGPNHRCVIDRRVRARVSDDHTGV